MGMYANGAPRSRVVVTVLILLGVGLGGAALVLSRAGWPSATLTVYRVGPAGHHLDVAAAPAQHPVLVVAPGPPSASAIVPRATTSSGRLGLADGGAVFVTISTSRRPIPAAHARWIIHHFFNNTPEHLTIWHGRTVDRGVVPCSTPSGSCAGYVGGMTELRDATLYDVMVHASTRATAWAVVNSVRVAS